jgi:hypothetical protein
MTRSMSFPLQRVGRDQLPESLPSIRLHRGEALWVLAHLGFQGSASASTFHEYVKSLRKLGIPEIKLDRQALASYSYYQLMELALVLTLRTYNVVPDSLLVGIAQYRSNLYGCYRRAYLERDSGIGEPIVIRVDDQGSMRARGAFLDLQFNLSGGKLISIGPPKLISPFEALAIYMGEDHSSNVLMPINLSIISERLVSTALHAPRIQRGPHPRREAGLLRLNECNISAN